MQYGDNEYGAFVHAVNDAMLTDLVSPIPFGNIGTKMTIELRVLRKFFKSCFHDGRIFQDLLPAMLFEGILLDGFEIFLRPRRKLNDIFSLSHCC